MFIWLMLISSLSFAQNIAITAVTPRNVCVNETITIEGRGFDRVSRVRFNGVLLELSRGEFTVVDNKTITFQAPFAAITNGQEQVTTVIYSGLFSSDRFDQNMSVNPIPTIPSNPSGSSYCESGPVSSVSVNDPGTGFRIDWYNQPTGGTILGSGTSYTPAGPGTYYAEKVNISTGCYSTTRVSASVSVFPSPDPPSGANNSEFCQGDPVSVISVNNPGGGFRIDWYDAASGGNFLASGTSYTPSGPGTFYAETFNTTTLCSSLTRTPVTAKRNAAPPAAAGVQGSSYCSGDPVTPVSVKNPGSGFRIEWYSAPTGGTLLGTGLTFTPSGPGTYYAEMVNISTSCRSLSRESAKVTEHPLPPAPNGAAGSSFCKGDPISSVSVNNPGSGFRIDWYDSETGGNLLGSGVRFTPGGPGKYFAETVNLNTSCTSGSRVSATLTENPAPPAPAGAKDSENCEGESPNPISVNNPGSGFRIDWYEDPSGGSKLGSGPSYDPSKPGTYYAETVNLNTSCKSLTRTAVKVTEYPSPPVAKNPVGSEFCPVEDTPPISVDNPGAGYTVFWYKKASGGALAEGKTSGSHGEIFTPSEKISASYYAEIRNDNSQCVSNKRTEVKMVVDEKNCSDTKFISYSFDEQNEPAKINETNHVIRADVVFGTPVKNLIAKFKLPAGAVARVNGTVQKSGVTPNDFSSPVTYQVTAADGQTKQNWEVRVTVALNTETDFVEYGFPEQIGNTRINRSNNTISVDVPFGTNRNGLVATFKLPAGAMATVNGVEQVSSETANDFRKTATYVVTAQDGVTRENWKVNVNEQELNDKENPVITAISLPNEYPVGSDSTLASISASDDSRVKKVVFRYKKYQAVQWQEEEVPLSDSVISFPITPDAVGSHGMLYYFKAFDLANRTDSSAVVNMVLRYNDENSPAIPDLKFGSNVQDYQIISLPLTLDKSSVQSIFNELMPYDKKDWRLYHYSDSETGEFGQTFTSIEAGKGYWLILRNKKEIKTGAGITTRMEKSTGLTLRLEPGWNQIGNPYNFEISWDNVIDYNADQSIKRIKLYRNGILSESDRIPPFTGGFVFSSWDQPVIIQVPANPEFPNDRLADVFIEKLPENIDGLNWYLPLTLSSGKFMNLLNGIGMHPESSDDFDGQDEPLLPMPHEIGGVEMYFLHPGEKYEKISRDIVKPAEAHTWEFEVRSFNSSGQISLEWGHINFSDDRYGLFLADLTGKKIIDMGAESAYTFQTNNLQKFKIYFGDRDKLALEVLPLQTEVGDIYPNPFDNELLIPLKLGDENQNYRLEISLSDLQGRTVHRFVSLSLEAGMHEISLVLNGSQIKSQSFYILKINIISEEFEKVVYRKVLRN